MNLQESFARAVEGRRLLLPGDRVLAGVSGGADSVALLRLLHALSRALPLSVVAAHVNHRLRGAASEKDQRFTGALATRLGMDFVALPVEGAPPRGEEASRRERHRLLARAASERRCGRIALGHTMDDQAETVLMRLIRGTGRRGLSGMAWSGPGRLVRPMLGIRRAAARAYLESLGQDFRQDESNLDPRFLRNRIRLEVLPALERLNPRIVEGLARAAGLLRDEDELLDRLASDWAAGRARPGPPGVALEAAALAGLEPALARRAARAILRDAGAGSLGLPAAAVDRLLELASSGRPGSEAHLPGGMRAWLSGLDLIVGRESGPPAGAPDGFTAVLPIPGRVDLPRGGAAITATLAPAAGTRLERGPDAAVLDAGRLGPNAVVRSRLPGDRIRPLGAPGRRTVADVLKDRKVPRPERDLVPLVVGPEGIAWIAGVAIGHPYRVTGETAQVVILEIERAREGPGGSGRNRRII
ncbi:MAG TPA: tRNA lysidine(34) synthetase TilS [Candidatus Polarisedimenticolia bacterium]|nr:tRNA lysidine(34) synthetase TilS [Candidatus Polarisedimenticolia bacterium]